MNYEHIQIIQQDEKPFCLYEDVIKKIYTCRKMINNKPCSICSEIEKLREIKIDSGKRQQLIRKYIKD